MLMTDDMGLGGRGGRHRNRRRGCGLGRNGSGLGKMQASVEPGIEAPSELTTLLIERDRLLGRLKDIDAVLGAHDAVPQEDVKW